MSLSIVLVGLLPILLFVILDLYASPKVAIVASVAAAIGIGIFYYVRLEEWDHSISAEVGLFVIFGAIAWRMNNPRLFKFQPVVVGVGTAAFLAGYQILYGPYFLKAAALLEKISPETKEQMANPKVQAIMAEFSLHSIFAILIHALILAWIAAKKSSWAWGLWRAAIWPILFGLIVIEGLAA